MTEMYKLDVSYLIHHDFRNSSNNCFFFFLLHRNGIKLGNSFGTCYVNSKNKIMDMLCWQNWKKKTALEINGKLIWSSGNIWYCSQTKSWLEKSMYISYKIL